MRSEGGFGTQVPLQNGGWVVSPGYGPFLGQMIHSGAAEHSGRRRL